MTIPVGAFSSAFRTYYLGSAGSMRALRIPDSGVQSPVSRSETVHQLISGGTAVTRRKDTRRTWNVNFSGCTPDIADLLVGFYSGVFGAGPFRFVDPAWRNALHVDTSTFGAPVQAVSGWSVSVSAQAVFFDPATVAPIATSGVAEWAVAQNGSRVGLGTWNGSGFIPNPVKAPPYLSSQVTSVSLYARAVSGTPSLSLRGLAVTSAGVPVSTTTSTVTLSSSAWQQLSVAVPPGLTAAYVVPDLLCNTNSSFIQLTCAAVQYGKSPPDPWVVGLGIPSVVISSGLGAQYTLLYARDHSLTLAEV